MGSIEDVQSAGCGGLVGRVAALLKLSRGIEAGAGVEELSKKDVGLFDALKELSGLLQAAGHPKEADVFDHVSQLAKTSKDHGGLELAAGAIADADIAEVEFLISAWLEALNSADRARQVRSPVATKPAGRRPMNLTEKIFAMHDVSPRGSVRPGETIRVSVDWIMASEASWSSMEKTYNSLGKPGIFRNDRFWLAGDHVVDPRNRTNPVVAGLVQASERAKKVFKMTEYQGMNYTIMHTEFYRERAQPGMIVIGSDSHTCSSGAVGCLAVGLGVADVTMALVTGEVWFQVPEAVNIRLVGRPPRGIGGKDVILYVLQQLRRNTVAADRVVEYTGPGLRFLGPDARFAVCNMTTEFGGISGVFAPDAVTAGFVNGRRVAKHRQNNSTYLRPDENAEYAATHEIDLARAESFVARYPNPDDVVAVGAVAGTPLDGCFVGACTTAEEDIVLGALVLEQGLKNGLRPVARGTRKVVPGSRPILDMLRKTGLADVYESAGFEVGAPGCSYCVGMSADRAGEGEVWLSSQNRNFENRMGKGSIGNLASAATVAASSFDMKITDPRALIDQIDAVRWESLKGRGSLRPLDDGGHEPCYVEPWGPADESTADEPAAEESAAPVEDATPTAAVDVGGDDGDGPSKAPQENQTSVISGKVQRLGDFIDTDALAPAQFLVEARTNEAIGSHCLEFTHPDFRARAKDGFDIVVAGRAFGCGSSREQAVSALLGTGVKCVIARSFAFIYSRNQPSLGLLGITLSDERFFELARDGAAVEVRLEGRNNVVVVGGEEFPFQLSRMEKELLDLGGITPAFMKFGKQLFDALCGPSAVKPKRLADEMMGSKPLQW